MTKRFPCFLIFGLFIVITFLFFKDVICSNWLFVYRDIGRYIYPVREFSFSLLKDFEFPLWNPHNNCGIALFATLIPGIFYPLSLIYLIGEFSYNFNYFIYAIFVFGAFFTYLLAKEWKLSTAAAIFAAITFSFSGFMVSGVNLVTQISSGIFFPLVLLFFFRKKTIPCAISLLFMFFGGETLYVYFTFALLLILSLIKRRKDFISIVTLFMLLSAIQLLPFLELLKFSSRPEMTLTAAMTWSVPAYDLLNLFFPYISDIDFLFKDYWHHQSFIGSYYLGVAPLVLAGLAIFYFYKNSQVRLLFGIFLGATLLSMGAHTPLYPLLMRILPGFSLSRFPIKFFFFSTFSLALLAGFGLDAFYQKVAESARLQKVIRSAFIFLFFAAIGAFLINIYFDKIYFFLSSLLDRANFIIPGGERYKRDLIFVNLFNLKRMIVFWALFLSILFVTKSELFRRRFFGLVIILFIIFDLFTVNKNTNYFMDRDLFTKPESNIEFLKDDKEIFRVFTSPLAEQHNTNLPEDSFAEAQIAMKERLITNRNMNFRIPAASSYSAIELTRHRDYFMLIKAMKLPSDTRLLDVINVKYVLSPKTLEIPGYTLVKENEYANIYQNQNYLPRAFFAECAITITDTDEIAEKMKTLEWNPEEEVIIEEDPHTSVIARESAEGGQPKQSQPVITHYSPRHITITATTDHPIWIVLSDSYYPGWHATINNSPAKIYQANYIMRAVYLGEAGEYTVEFKYQPWSFYVGAGITLLTLLGILITVIRKK